MQQRLALHHVQHALGPGLVTRQQRVFEQLRLLRAQQPRQRERGTHVRQCIVRGAMFDAVGTRQVPEPEAWSPIVLARPFDALRAQRVRDMRSTSIRSQRVLPLRHSRSYGSWKLRNRV